MLFMKLSATGHGIKGNFLLHNPEMFGYFIISIFCFCNQENYIFVKT